MRNGILAITIVSAILLLNGCGGCFDFSLGAADNKPDCYLKQQVTGCDNLSAEPVRVCENSPDYSFAASRIPPLDEKAKSYLAMGLYTDARKTYEDILLYYDPNFSEAQFGWSVAALLEMINDLMIDSGDLIGELDGAINYESPGKFSSFAASGATGPGIFGNLFISFFEDYKVTLQTAIEYLEAAKNDPNFVYSIESLPIIIGPAEQIAEAAGCYDNSAVAMLQSMARTMLASIELLNSINYQVDIITVVNVLEAYLQDYYERDARDLAAIIAFAVGSSPDLFTIYSSENLAESGRLLGQAAQGLSRALDESIAEGYSSETEVLKYTAGDDGPVHYLVFRGAIDENGDWQPGDQTTILLPDELSATAQKLADILLGTTDAAAQIMTGAELSLLVRPLLQLMGVYFEALFSDVFSPDLLEQYFSADQVVCLSGQAPGSIFNDTIGFDLKSFFRGEPTPRDLYPAAVTVAPAADDPATALDSSFVMEWECSDTAIFAEDSLLPGLVCAGGDEDAADTAHFPGGVSRAVSFTDDYEQFLTENSFEQIPADGQISYLPYFYFSDEIGKLIYLQDSVDAGQYLPADNYSLNLWLAKTFSALIMSYDMCY